MFGSFINFFRRAFIMQYYLVVIDTTHTFHDAKMSKGLQNFYIVLAPSVQEAKNRVLGTFRNNPAMVAQLAHNTTATLLTPIMKLLTPQEPMWSYIPFDNKRAPGQQKRYPDPQAMLDPRTIVNQKTLQPLDPRPLDEVANIRNFDINAAKTGVAGISPVPPVAPPKVYAEQIKKDSAIFSKKEDAMDQLLSDPAFKAKLMAKLLGEPIPADPIGSKDDPNEVALRYVEPTSYDDDVSAIPKGPVNLPPEPEELKKIPGSKKADATTLKRLKGNITPLGPIVHNPGNG
jgi:hypothetical protein